MSRIEKARRGIWERVPGSGLWWIRYRANDQLRRETVGRKSDAIRLYETRKVAITAGAKLPANMRCQRVTVAQIGQNAIDGYANHHRKDLRAFKSGMNWITAALGRIEAERLKTSEIDAWLSSSAS